MEALIKQIKSEKSVHWKVIKNSKDVTKTILKYWNKNDSVLKIIECNLNVLNEKDKLVGKNNPIKGHLRKAQSFNFETMPTPISSISFTKRIKEGINVSPIRI